MEINNNLSTNGVNGSVTPAAQRPTPASAMPSDQISLTNLSSADEALKSLPDSRPDVVERAKSLIADPNYPSSSMMSALSQKLASAFSFETQ